MISVFKIGGSLLRKPEDYKKVANYLAVRGGEKVIVVSAMKGITQQLRGLVEDPRLDVFRSNVCERYYDAMDEVGGDVQPLNALEEEGVRVLKRLRRSSGSERALLADKLVALGEFFSTAVIAEALLNLGVRAKALSGGEAGIVTDGSFGHARPLFPRCLFEIRASLFPIIRSGQIPVVSGFTGVTPSGAITTLGSGGSDLSATLIGAALSVSRIELWTDSGGIYTGDPDRLEGALLLPRASLGEADAMAKFRVKNFHPLTFKPLKAFDGVVAVLDPFDNKGTVISRKRCYPPLKTVRRINRKLLVIGWGALNLSKTIARIVGASTLQAGRFYAILCLKTEEAAMSAYTRVHDYIVFDLLRGEAPWLTS